ncbi:MAG: hypothetical protein LBT00_15815 [Spirochaetaceae bacterium]|nr:hypothetical protein [Spirochaetaceae bacterium]
MMRASREWKIDNGKGEMIGRARAVSMPHAFSIIHARTAHPPSLRAKRSNPVEGHPRSGLLRAPPSQCHHEPLRHCERSEAIQRVTPRLDCFTTSKLLTANCLGNYVAAPSQ